MAGLLEFSTTYKPFKYPWAMNIAEEHEKIHWGTWEAKLQEDVNQWKGGHTDPRAFFGGLLRTETNEYIGIFK